MKKLPVKTKGIIGIDEVGRGPLAGPVTLCAVYVENPNLVKKILFKNTIRDSKRINKALRFNIYKTIRKNRLINNSIIYSVKSRSAKSIDREGITEAIKQCLVGCMNDLQKQGVSIKKVIIRLDAGLKIGMDGLIQQSYIRGDERFLEIALASILAKETRDTYMKNLGRLFPNYLWDKNAGYGTKKHREAIINHGITKYHRTSYLKNFESLEKPE